MAERFAVAAEKNRQRSQKIGEIYINKILNNEYSGDPEQALSVLPAVRKIREDSLYWAERAEWSKKMSHKFYERANKLAEKLNHSH